MCFPSTARITLGLLKALSSCCFLISCVIYLCCKLLIAGGNQGNTAGGGAHIMDWLFHVSPALLPIKGRELEILSCIQLSWLCFTRKRRLVLRGALWCHAGERRNIKIPGKGLESGVWCTYNVQEGHHSGDEPTWATPARRPFLGKTYSPFHSSRRLKYVSNVP